MSFFLPVNTAPHTDPTGRLRTPYSLIDTRMRLARPERTPPWDCKRAFGINAKDIQKNICIVIRRYTIIRIYRSFNVNNGMKLMISNASIMDIAFQILKEEGRPLHYREVLALALSKGLVQKGRKRFDQLASLMDLSHEMYKITQGYGDPRFVSKGVNLLGLADGDEAASGGALVNMDNTGDSPVMPFYMGARLANMPARQFRHHALLALSTKGISDIAIDHEVKMERSGVHILFASGNLYAAANASLPVAIKLVIKPTSDDFAPIDTIRKGSHYFSGKLGIIVANRNFTETSRKNAGEISLIGVQQVADILIGRVGAGAFF